MMAGKEKIKIVMGLGKEMEMEKGKGDLWQGEGGEKRGEG